MEESNKISLGKLFCTPCCILVHANLLAFCWLLLLPCEKTNSCSVLNNEQHLNLLHIYGLLPLWVAINVVKINLCIVLLIFDVWACFFIDCLHFRCRWPLSWSIFQIVKLQQTFLDNQQGLSLHSLVIWNSFDYYSHCKILQLLFVELLILLLW